MSGWVEAFIVIAAIAIVVQMAILLAMFLQLKTSIEEFTRIAKDLQAASTPSSLALTASWMIPKTASPASWAMAPRLPASRAARRRKWTAFLPKLWSGCAFR